MSETPLTLTLAQARRVAVRAQLLTAGAPPTGEPGVGGTAVGTVLDSVLGTVRHLTLLQLDPTAYVARNADLVLWSRIGDDYRPVELADLLETQALLELRMTARPAGDLRLFTAEMAAWPGAGRLTAWQLELRDWVGANDGCRRDVLAALRADGPLSTAELPDTCAVGWRSSGWTDGRNLPRLLDLMVQRGEVAVAGREGGRAQWDLASRVYPDDEPVPLDDALAERAARRLRALGVARQRSAQAPGEPNDVGDAGVEARVDGVRGRWRVHPAYLGEPVAEEERVVLLSPLDRLVFDRRRMAELWGFDYVLEMYKPAARRRFGYWALPVLAGDALVGKIDVETDREAGEVLVHAVHTDRDWSRALRDAVDARIDALAGWLGLTAVRP